MHKPAPALLALAALAVVCYFIGTPASSAFFHKDAPEIGNATIEVAFSPDMARRIS